MWLKLFQDWFLFRPTWCYNSGLNQNHRTCYQSKTNMFLQSSTWLPLNTVYSSQLYLHHCQKTGFDKLHNSSLKQIVLVLQFIFNLDQIFCCFSAGWFMWIPRLHCGTDVEVHIFTPLLVNQWYNLVKLFCSLFPTVS